MCTAVGTNFYEDISKRLNNMQNGVIDFCVACQIERENLFSLITLWTLWTFE